MNAAPSMIADHPARRAPAGSFLPNCCPTRTAAAELIPNGTMNVERGAIQCNLVTGQRDGTEFRHHRCSRRERADL